MRNSSGNLSARNQPVDVSELFGVSERNNEWVVEFEQVIEVFVSGSEDFSLIDLH